MHSDKAYTDGAFALATSATLDDKDREEVLETNLRAFEQSINRLPDWVDTVRK